MRVSAKMPEVFPVELTFFVQDFPAPKQSSLGASAWRSLIWVGELQCQNAKPLQGVCPFCSLA